MDFLSPGVSMRTRLKQKKKEEHFSSFFYDQREAHAICQSYSKIFMIKYSELTKRLQQNYFICWV